MFVGERSPLAAGVGCYRSWIYTSVLVACCGLACAVNGREGTSADGSPRPVRLILQITVDGLRADLLSRYGDRFGDGGFRALMDRGAVYSNAHYEHANTETVVGHATLATGAPPSEHGMIGNVWFDREAGELAYNIEDREYPLLPTWSESVEGPRSTRPRSRLEPRAALRARIGTLFEAPFSRCNPSTPGENEESWCGSWDLRTATP
jgi:hypothetical protein